MKPEATSNLTRLAAVAQDLETQAFHSPDPLTRTQIANQARGVYRVLNANGVITGSVLEKQTEKSRGVTSEIATAENHLSNNDPWYQPTGNPQTILTHLTQTDPQVLGMSQRDTKQRQVTVEILVNKLDQQRRAQEAQTNRVDYLPESTPDREHILSMQVQWVDVDRLQFTVENPEIDVTSLEDFQRQTSLREIAHQAADEELRYLVETAKTSPVDILVSLKSSMETHTKQLDLLVAQLTNNTDPTSHEEVLKLELEIRNRVHLARNIRTMESILSSLPEDANIDNCLDQVRLILENRDFSQTLLETDPEYPLLMSMKNAATQKGISFYGRNNSDSLQDWSQLSSESVSSISRQLIEEYDKTEKARIKLIEYSQSAQNHHKELLKNIVNNADGDEFTERLIEFQAYRNPPIFEGHLRADGRLDNIRRNTIINRAGQVVDGYNQAIVEAFKHQYGIEMSAEKILSRFNEVIADLWAEDMDFNQFIATYYDTRTINLTDEQRLFLNTMWGNLQGWLSQKYNVNLVQIYAHVNEKSINEFISEAFPIDEQLCNYLEYLHEENQVKRVAANINTCLTIAHEQNVALSPEKIIQVCTFIEEVKLYSGTLMNETQFLTDVLDAVIHNLPLQMCGIECLRWMYDENGFTVAPNLNDQTTVQEGNVRSFYPGASEKAFLLYRAEIVKIAERNNIPFQLTWLFGDTDIVYRELADRNSPYMKNAKSYVDEVNKWLANNNLTNIVAWSAVEFLEAHNLISIFEKGIEYLTHHLDSVYKLRDGEQTSTGLNFTTLQHMAEDVKRFVVNKSGYRREKLLMYNPASIEQGARKRMYMQTANMLTLHRVLSQIFTSQSVSGKTMGMEHLSRVGLTYATKKDENFPYYKKATKLSAISTKRFRMNFREPVAN